MFNSKEEVPSLELCKRLKELGYPQAKGGFWWVKFATKKEYLERAQYELFYWDLDGTFTFVITEDEERIDNCCCQGYKPFVVGDRIKAPTVRELGEWLPYRIIRNNKKYKIWFLEFEKWCGGWEYRYWELGTAGDVCSQEGKTEADTRAKMLIWLVENGYVKFQEE